jgi:sialidase-1
LNSIRFLLLLSAVFIIHCTPPNPSFQNQVYLNGEGGYDCYRIPALLQTPQGTLMAFAEGRKSGCSDFGDVDLLLKTSKDNGLHWSEAKVIAEFDSLQAGNPAPVQMKAKTGHNPWK